MKPKVILASAILAVGLAALAWSAWKGFIPARAIQPGPPAGGAVPVVRDADPAPLPQPPERYVAGVEDLTAAGVGEVVAAETVDRVKQLAAPLPQSADLSLSVQEAVTAILSDTRSAFDSSLAKRGVEPPPTDSAAGELWTFAHQVFGKARFDPEGVEVRAREWEEPRPSGGAGLQVRTATRHQARAFLRTLDVSKVQCQEVLVPGFFRDLRGREFEAIMGLEFTHDPSAQVWVLTRVSLYEVPLGTNLPPLPI